METFDFKLYANLYKTELLDNVLPFWLNHSIDKEYGGYFTCLNRDGSVYDTDKFVWLQGRQVWMFSKLYNELEKQKEWLDCALHGAEFLKKYAHDGSYNWYFSLTREGKPLVQPYNIFSYTFACMAFGQLYKATGIEEYATIARKTFHLILKRIENPKAQWNKAYPGSRPLKSFSIPMIISNMLLEIEELVEPELVDKTIDYCVHEVLEVFYQPDLGVLLENMTIDNQLSDSYDGRLIDPGHGIEATWFMMDLGKRMNRPDIIEKALKITKQTFDYGWDKEYGGIFYFMDRKGYPVQQLEWDQKLWWVHLETLIATIKGYLLTGDEEALEYFKKVHDYTWRHFRDPEYGEWFGYLNRQGEVLLPLKGGKWKGCFHVPRGLYLCWKLLEECAAK